MLCEAGKACVCEAGKAYVRLARPVFVSPTSPRNDGLFARKVLFLRTLFEEFTDSCRCCNVYASAGYGCGKIGKGLRDQLSAPRAHNLLRRELCGAADDSIIVYGCVWD